MHRLCDRPLTAGRQHSLCNNSAGAQITWRWQGFANPARADGLQLEHWVKCYKDPAGKVKPAEEGEYSFAKYNKKVWELLKPTTRLATTPLTVRL